MSRKSIKHPVRVILVDNPAMVCGVFQQDALSRVIPMRKFRLLAHSRVTGSQFTNRVGYRVASKTLGATAVAASRQDYGSARELPSHVYGVKL